MSEVVQRSWQIEALALFVATTLRAQSSAKSKHSSPESTQEIDRIDADSIAHVDPRHFHEM